MATRTRRGETNRGLGAEQWAVLGFSALGLFAVYKLLTGKKPPSGTTDTVESGVATVPSRVPMLAQNIVRGDGTAQVKTGTPYRGRLELSPAAIRSTREAIVADLLRAGFTNVTVYTTLAEASAAIPLPTALEGAGSGSRWFVGTWMGPTAVQPMGNIVLLWPTVG